MISCRAVLEMRVLWPLGVVCLGDGFKPPCAALAEDCRGERSGKRHLEVSGGDREGVALKALSCGAVFTVEASK